MDYRPAFAPYLDQLRARIGELRLFDAHTHVGHNDPDGFAQSAPELLARLDECDARALVFPMHEPDGYLDGRANDEVIAAAADPRLAALARVDPNAGPDSLAELRRALDAGASGLKLHPRGEDFTLGHPMVDDLIAEAAGRRAPVLVHAGRGIPALGRDAVRLAQDHPGARLILAHAAISDLSWLWRVLPEVPNLFVDTSWWNPADVLAVYTQVPPGQVLWASDSPYGVPLVAAVEGLRCAVQAGLSPDQLRATAGGQLERMLDGEEPLDLGPAPRRPLPLDPTLDRVVTHLCAAIGRVFGRADATEPIALAELACDVDPGDEVAPVCRATAELLQLYRDTLAPAPPGQAFPQAIRYLIGALFIARTPSAGIP